MKTWIFAFGIVLLLAPIGKRALAQTESSPPDTSAASPPVTGYKVHNQFGLFTEFAGRHREKDDSPLLLTWDLALIARDRSRSHFGFGLHGAADEDGTRLALRGLWRRPLHPDTGDYTQIALGIYVADSDDSADLDFPGALAEAEIGLGNLFAVTAACEYRPGTHEIWVPTGPYGSLEPMSVRSTPWSGYIGAKFGQVPGVVTMLGVLAAAAIAMASMSSMSFNWQ